MVSVSVLVSVFVSNIVLHNLEALVCLRSSIHLFLSFAFSLFPIKNMQPAWHSYCVMLFFNFDLFSFVEK